MDNGNWKQKIPTNMLWGVLQPDAGASTSTQPVRNPPPGCVLHRRPRRTAGSTASSASTINSLGQVVGTCQYGVSSFGYNENYGFFYDGITMHNLGNIGGDLTCPLSLNNHGLVCGFASVDPGQEITRLLMMAAFTTWDIFTASGLLPSA